jgi:hypothetical protein
VTAPDPPAGAAPYSVDDLCQVAEVLVDETGSWEMTQARAVLDFLVARGWIPPGGQTCEEWVAKHICVGCGEKGPYDSRDDIESVVRQLGWRPGRYRLEQRTVTEWPDDHPNAGLHTSPWRPAPDTEETPQ